MTDGITCKECGYESVRQVKSFDFNLPIKDHVSAVSSIEEAIARYLTEELLEGDNQYACP